MDPSSPFNTDEVLKNGSLLKQSLFNQFFYFSQLSTVTSIMKKEHAQKFLTLENSQNSFIENLLKTNPENDRNLFKRYQNTSTTQKFFDKLSSNTEFSMKNEVKKWKFVRKLRTMPATSKDISKSKSICRAVSIPFPKFQTCKIEIEIDLLQCNAGPQFTEYRGDSIPQLQIPGSQKQVHQFRLCGWYVGLDRTVWLQPVYY